MMESSSRSSVIIVGAGISGEFFRLIIIRRRAQLLNWMFWNLILCLLWFEGIAAAKVLAENGVEDLVILEASDRVGGRIRKEPFGGVSVELGAGWIAGVGGPLSNPVWELAAQFGIRTCFSDYSNARYNIYDRRSIHIQPKDAVCTASSVLLLLTRCVSCLLQREHHSEWNSCWLVQKSGGLGDSEVEEPGRRWRRRRRRRRRKWWSWSRWWQ